MELLFSKARTTKNTVVYREVGDEPRVGWIYVQKKQPNEALPLLSEALERQPENAEYHFHLGMAYAGTGAVVQARSELTQALADSREFPGRAEAMRVKTDLDRAPSR